MAGKLNYWIHDPNPAEVTAEYIAKVLVEVNRKNFESRLREAMPPTASEGTDSRDDAD